MQIEFTSLGLQQAQNLEQSVAEYKGKPIRLYLEGKGCDGFFYGVCFDTERPDDTSILQGSLKIVVDKETLQYVDGSSIDWVDDERGKGFLVSNPNHKQFRGKFFKRKQWKTKLMEKS